MICPNCGYENQEMAKFCGKCGSWLTDQTGENSAVSAPGGEERKPVDEPKTAVEPKTVAELKTVAEPKTAAEPKSTPVEKRTQSGSQPAPPKADAAKQAKIIGEHMTIPNRPADPDVQTPGKKKRKLGNVVFPVLAIAGLAAGFYGGRSIAPKENSVTRTFHYDTTPLSMAAGFTYEGISGKGTVEVFGPQGTSLGQIADVMDDSFLILEKAGKIIFLDAEGQLCEQSLPAGEKKVLAEHGNWETVWVSEDGSCMTYANQVDGLTETMIYEVKEGKTRRMTDGIVKNQYLDIRDHSLYYLDETNTLYQYKDLSERNRIKGDVTSYQVLSSKPAVLWQSQDADEGSSFGVKWAEEEERLKGFLSVTNAAIDNESQLLLVQGWEEEESSDGLYVWAKGQEPIEAYGDIAEFFHADNLNMLYYRTVDGTLYSISLSVFEPETVSDSSKLKAAVKALEKQKLSSDAMQMGISPNGEHLAWISSDGELHYRHFQSDKELVLGEQAAELSVYDQSLYAMKTDGTMIRFVYRQGEAVSVNDSLEQPAGAARVSTLYGDYLAVAGEETKTLQVLDRENGLATLIPDLTAYDKAVVQGKTVYEKPMDYSQVIGSWRLKDEGVILTFKEDQTLGIYEIPDYKRSLSDAGEERSISLKPKGISKFCLETGAQEEFTTAGGQELLTSTSAVLLEEGEIWYWKMNGEAEPVPMEKMNDGKIQTLTRNIQLAMNYEAEAQERSQYLEAERERVEEQRREEERRRQEEQQKRDNLLSRAKNYYYNDVYMQSGSYYYSSPNLSSRTSTYVTRTVKKYVYSYQVDYSNSIIWLQVTDSKNNYRWIYMR